MKLLTMTHIILSRGGEVVSRKAHNLETPGANPGPATSIVRKEDKQFCLRQDLQDGAILSVRRGGRVGATYERSELVS